MSSYTRDPSDLDAYVDDDNPTTAYGSDTTFKVGVSCPCAATQVYRGFLRFDLGSNVGRVVPITGTKLRLYCTASGNSTNEDNWGVYRITQTAWTESATWNKYDGSNDWAAAGGDFTDTDPPIQRYYCPKSADAPLWTEISGAQLNAQVAYAIFNNVGSAKQVHLALKQYSEVTAGERVCTYSSREAASNKPQLVVVYRRKMILSVIPWWLQFIGVGLAFIIHRRMVLVVAEPDKVLFHGRWRKYKKWLRG